MLPPAGFSWRRLLPWAVFAVVAVVAIGFVASDYWTSLIVQGLVFAMVYLSLVVVTGVGGMVSLAQAAFVSVAGLVAGYLWSATGLSFLMCVLVALAVAMVIGALAALPALRLGGLALALATLALAFLCDQILFPLNVLSNTGQGWQIPRIIAGLNLTSVRSFGLFCLALLLIVTLMVRNFERSPSGRAIIAVRSSPVGAASAGISLVKAKLVVFVFSAGIAGLAGILLSMLLQQVTPGAYPPHHRPAVGGGRRHLRPPPDVRRLRRGHGDGPVPGPVRLRHHLRPDPRDPLRPGRHRARAESRRGPTADAAAVRAG